MKFGNFFLILILMSISVQALMAESTLRERIKDKIKERREKKEKPLITNIVGTNDFTIDHQGEKRKYRLHVPASYRPGQPAALLIAMHGGGGSMEIQSNDKYYKLISKSEKEGFLVVFPNGTSKFRSGKFATWNAGSCCGRGRDQNVDDVGFIRQMIVKISSEVSTDPKKIFATGMSNGGLMAYRLACELSDVIKGIASIAGTDNTINCTPKNPVSILHIHAKNDNHVLFNGGSGPNAVDIKFITNFTSVPATISKWVKLNACNDKPKRVLDKAGAYCDLYSPCKNNVKVQICVTETGGHSWPGGIKPRGGAGTNALSANDMMWDFFQK